MSNKWIISDYKFHEHRTLEQAEVELKRLTEKCPKKKFHIYRIKGRLTPSDAGAKIKELQARIKELECPLSIR